MAGKTKPGIPVKGINIKLKMINDLIDVTGSAKDSWNPAEISDDMKAIAYIHDLADTWNPAQLNEALKYLGFATIDSWNPAIIEETKNKLVKYFLPTDASGNPIELDLKGVLPYEVTTLTIDLLPIQDLSHGEPSPTNICPISGRNSVTLTVNSDDIETTFENPVYGGKVDFVSGKLTVTRKYVKVKLSEAYSTTQGTDCDRYNFSNVFTSNEVLNSGNGNNDNSISSHIAEYKYNTQDNVHFYFSSNGIVLFVPIGTPTTTEIEFCGTLTTPIEITLTAEQISLLNGINTLSTDGDNINITYKANLNS